MITLDNCRVYYSSLKNESVNIAQTSCGELVHIPTCDFDDKGFVDLQEYSPFYNCLMKSGPMNVLHGLSLKTLTCIDIF